MSNCVDNVLKMLRVIEHEKTSVKMEIPDGKQLKFDDQKISPEEIVKIFKDGKYSESVADTIATKMGPLSRKIRSLNYINYSALSKILKHLEDPEKVVSYSIAIKELLDSQTSEYNKMLKQNTDIPITKISDNGIMNVGLARSAAVIGRKYLYTKGLRIRSNPEEGVYISPAEIEAREYNLGMSILTDMEKNGLVTLREGEVINDFYKDKNSNIPKTSTIKMPVALPRLENMLDDTDYKNNIEYYKQVLKGEIVENNEANTISDLQTLVNAIHNMKISPMESLPNTKVPTEEQMKKNDVIKLSNTGKKFRTHLASVPVQIHEAMIPMFVDLAAKWKASNKSFKAFMENLVGDDYYSLQKAFGVNKVEDFADDLSNSIYGQNKSKLDPLENFLNNINYFIDKGISNDIYMNYNIVRNARFNMDNSILNSQSSKFFRNATVSKKTTLEVKEGEEAVIGHFVDSIMERLEDLDIEFKGEIGSQELLNELLGITKNEKLEYALNHLDVLAGRTKTKTSVQTAIAFADNYANGNIASAIAVLDGIKDLRVLFNEGKVTTSYNTMSDATASGGTIGLAASLGYDSKTLEAIKDLGLLKGEEGTLDDVYGILSKDLENLVSKEKVALDIIHADKKGLELLPQFLEVVYNNKMRNLSKSPSMTFIYNQGKKGAIKTIAINATETLLKNATDPKTLEYINQLTGKEYTENNVLGPEAVGLKKELIKALQDPKKSPIPFIHKRLESTVGDLIAKRKEIIENLYKVLADKKGKNIRILTPLAYLDGVEDNSKSRVKYGMPLSKVQNILNKKGDKAYVVTMEERENPTTALVNTTHGQDMAIAAIAVDNAIKEFKKLYKDEEVPGITFVHDEIITSPKLGVLVDKHYIKAFKKVVSEFSVEQQLLNQIKEIDPNNPIISRYENIIKEANKEKQKVLENYTEETGKIYGNKKGTYDIKTLFQEKSKTSKEDIPFAMDKEAFDNTANSLSKVNDTKTDIHELLKFNEKETDKLVSIFGKDKLNRMLEAIKFNKDRIKTEKTATPDEFKGTGSRYNPITDEVIIEVWNKDLRNINGMDVATKGLDTVINELPKLDSFNKKRVALELLSHELDHREAYGYIEEYVNAPEKEKTSSKYSAIHIVAKEMEKLEKALPNLLTDTLNGKLPNNPEIFERLAYMTSSQEGKVRKLLEFSAIMRNEPKFAEAVYNLLYKDSDKTSFKPWYTKVINAIKELVHRLTMDYLQRRDMNAKKLNILFQTIAKTPVNKELLKTALDVAYVNGLGVKSKNPKTNKSINAVDPLPENFDPEKNYNKRDSSKPEIVLGRTIQRMNAITKNLLIDKLENTGESLAKSVDKFLDVNFPLYSDVRKRVLGLYNESSLSSSLQSIADFVGATSLNNKSIKQDLISTWHNIKEDRSSREHKYLKEINDLTKDFTEKGKKELYDLVTKVPLHNYLRFDDELKTKEDVLKEITNLEDSLDSNNRKIVDDTVEFLNTGKVKEFSLYNLSNYDINSDTAKKVEKLIALKALTKDSLLDNLLNLRSNHAKLYKVIKDNSLALYMLRNKLHGMSTKGSLATHTLVNEQYKTRNKYTVFELKDRNKYDSGENLGYTIIKEPTETTLGVVMTRIQDDTFTTGVGVLEDIPKSDIIVPEHLANKYNLQKNNIIGVGNTYKLVLSREEKLKAGLIEDMGSTLVKSTANAITIDDTAYIRNKLMESSLRLVINSNEDTEAISYLEELIKNDLVDHPYVLKLGSKVEFDKLPKIIRDKYKPIQQNLSSVNNFNKEITHVRKDIRHWLVGGHVPSLFKNPKLQRMSILLKEAIAGSKIGMVMVNPKKIFNDIISNTTHLSLLGVPFSKIAMYQKDILKDVDSFNTIKNNLLEYELKYNANPTKQNKLKYEKLQNELKHHPLYTAYKNAYMSSLSSDILSSDASTTEGLQADIEAGIKYLLTDKDGNKNALHKILGTASKFGMNGTDVLRSIGRVTDTMNSDKEVSKYLEGVANRIDEIKEDDDMVKYLSQYTISPDAETVKAGTKANNLADMLMRETYRRHLIDNGVSPSKANEKAIAMAPFYPEDMPLGVKMLSDYFIIPFASWTLRVHKPIMYIIKNKFATLTTEELIANMLNTDLEIYANSHPFAKILQGNFVSEPVSEVGTQSLIPTNIFNF